MPTSVLVVDDNPIIRRVAERSLTLSGHDVSSVSDGGAAIVVLTNLSKNSERFDLIITDRDMPFTDGWGLVRWIRESEVWKRTPVVLMTGDEFSQDEQSRAESSYIALLNKPFTSSSLEEAIRKAKELCI